ncbi:MAG TPA: hypothetical protein VFA26_11415, partial [Gemmataceae bacterium]|nr:hypothetical protein [Gemmataceae bacterium]
DGPLDNNPRIEARFQDGFKDDQDKNNNNLTTMRFGLVMLGVKDPKDPKRLKRLTYDEWGRTNSTVVRVENQDWLFGFGPGRWVEREGKLDKGPDGAERKGMRSVWTTDPANVKVRVTQTVELVRGDSTNLLDTCRVRYLIENFEDQGGPSRTVGLRMVLDTFIGANDGVPFVIPGEKGLCDTQKEFQGDRVPDFIQAQENDRLDDPGTVAQVQFRIGGQVEPPARVTLGAWPDPQLSFPGRPQPWLAQWDVPVLPIREKARQLAGRLQPGEIVPPDSAVVMYWPEKPIKPGEKREVGFSYGLGKVSSDKEGRLALTVGGRLVVGGEFTLTALVSNPERGEKLTLTLPPGLKLVDGTEAQDVPPPALDAQRKTSPVTWRIKAEGEGAYELKVKSSANRQQSQKVRIKQERIF